MNNQIFNFYNYSCKDTLVLLLVLLIGNLLKPGDLSAQNIQVERKSWTFITRLAFQLGADFDLSSYILLNVDLRSVAMETKIEDGGNDNIKLKINPFSIGIGLGFRI